MNANVPTPRAVLHVKTEQVVQHVLSTRRQETWAHCHVVDSKYESGSLRQCYSPIVSPKHVNSVSVCHDSVLTAPGQSGGSWGWMRGCADVRFKPLEATETAPTHLSTCYLAPTNSSHGGSRLQRWTVSNGPKFSVKYSTLSEQLWSKSTLGATLVDFKDIVANSSGWIASSGPLVRGHRRGKRHRWKSVNSCVSLWIQNTSALIALEYYNISRLRVSNSRC